MGDGPEAGPLTHHQHERDTVCSAEVVIVIFHGNTILDQRVLHLVIERALDEIAVISLEALKESPDSNVRFFLADVRTRFVGSAQRTATNCY